MIASTKKELQGYAGEVFSLKNVISDLNSGYKDIGYGVDDDLFSEMDRELNRFMPGGDSKKLFDNFDAKVRNSQPVLSTVTRKTAAVKKNSLIAAGSMASSTFNGGGSLT